MENKPFHKYRSVWEHAELMERLRRIRHVALDMDGTIYMGCLLYTSPSPRDISGSRMPSSA